MRVPEVRAADAGIARGLLAIMSVAAGLTIANIYYIQPLLAEIGRTLSVSATAMGVVATLGQLGFAAGMVFVVPLGDITDRRRLILVMLCGAAASLASIALAPSYAWLAAAIFCVGFFSVGAQMFVPFAAHLAAPARRGAAVGIVMSGLLTGILLSRTASGYVATTAGWRSMYWIAAGLMLALAAVSALMLPRSAGTDAGTDAGTGASTNQLSYRRLLGSLWRLTQSEPVLRESAFAGAMLFASFSAFWSMLSFRLETPPLEYGSQVAGLFGLVGAAGVAAAPFAGRLADRLDPRINLQVTLAVATLAWLVFALVGHTIPGLVAGVLLLDVGVQAGHVTNLSRVHSLSPEARNRLTTVYMGTFFVGGAMGTAIAAYAWSRWGWSGVCAVGVTMPLLASIALLRPSPGRGFAKGAAR